MRENSIKRDLASGMVPHVYLGIEICMIDERVGLGVRCMRAHERGTVIEVFQGQVGAYSLQHTLQISQYQHILDLDFVGFLMHSCNPNSVLDMQRMCLLALKDIAPGEVLTIDYAVTEDELFKQFACQCGAPTCRGWVTGRREPVSPEGKTYFARARKCAA